METPLFLCYDEINKGRDHMGGFCVMLLIFFCVGWILVAYTVTMFVPVVTIYNGVISLLCLILYLILKKKKIFTKYDQGYKHVLSKILQYGLILIGIGSLLICSILAFLCFF